MKSFLSFMMALAILSSFLSSCKKDSAASTGYYVKANVNGTEINYTGFTSAMFLTIPSGQPTPFSVLNIEGMNTQDATTDVLALGITDFSAITTKTYTDVAVGYTFQGTISYYDASNNQYNSVMALTPAVKITITEITSSYVAGTFSGTAATISTGKTAVITNGSFKVKRQ
ncbi:MAG TPA: hypothetical protein VIJ75_17830 [Hanamia sp.]